MNNRTSKKKPAHRTIYVLRENGESEEWNENRKKTHNHSKNKTQPKKQKKKIKSNRMR